MSFLDWSNSPKRRKWVLYCFDSYGGGPSQRLRAVAKEQTVTPKVFDSAYCQRGELKQEDFVLAVDICSSRKPLIDRWFYVHRVVRVDRRDKRYCEGYPFQAGQLFKDSVCPAQPFHIDGAFRRAVRITYKEFAKNADRYFSVDMTKSPSKVLLEKPKKNYVAASRA